jgi:hypothetical protein
VAVASTGPVSAKVRHHNATVRLVVSDQVHYSADMNPSTHTFQSFTCTLTSEKRDANPFPCSVSGQLVPTTTGSAMNGTISSADGVTQFSASLTQGTGGGFTGAGSGTETDAADQSNKPLPPPNPCTVNLAASNVSGGILTGTFTVEESSKKR